ncbi:DMT family transporter [Oceanivirga salmonicida]|uniref:DMT family transporter n=1 Tax=Oceanivirga salmonicida TaxID=1769291 RepID=UPI000834129E|nr:EamA family transporter [Oceanivirga salmonicida]
MKKIHKGILLALLSSIFWAIGGNFTQYIFINSDFNFVTLVSIRMLLSGILITLFEMKLTGKEKAIEMLKDKTIWLPLLIFSIFGQIGIQLTFFATIKYSGAAFATLTSSLAPIIVIIYLSIKLKKRPRSVECIPMFTLFLGLFFVVTSANINTLLVDIRAVIYGIISACCFAFYLLYAKKLFKYPSTYIIGYTMIMGGVFLLPFSNLKMMITNLMKLNILFFFILLIVIGTVIPFCLFVESTRYVSSKIVSILSVCEPLISLAISIFIFHKTFTQIQLMGVFIVVFSVIVISIYSEE